MSNSELKENCIIRIKSSVEQEGRTESVELMTRGAYVQRGGSFFITYQETETTGYEGSTTVLRIAQDATRVTMLRYGKASAQLVIEKGRRNVCHYETGYGAITLGVTADEICSELTEKGGHVRFSYVLDMDSAEMLSKSSLDITVSPLG